MKFRNFAFLIIVLILIYFEQSTRTEARRTVQRNDKKLIRASDLRLIKPKMNRRKCFNDNK